MSLAESLDEKVAGAPMRVFLTFDVEVWCGGWDRLDERFPPAFRRYVYGASERHGYALPMTLRILNEHGIKGVFFVEPLFAARFGLDKLRIILELILEADHEVQLHLHPEWCDEASILSSGKANVKRPSLWQFNYEEQAELIRTGTGMIRAAGGPPMRAFRAGSFAANADTWRALAAEGYEFDSSVNATSEGSFPEGVSPEQRYARSRVPGLELESFPIGVFKDGFGRPRHAQVGACASEELTAAIDASAASGWTDYVLLSHGFEMLKPGSTREDPIVVRRFRRLCEQLRKSQDLGRIEVAGFDKLDVGPPAGANARRLPAAPASATFKRYLEQVIRRVG